MKPIMHVHATALDEAVDLLEEHDAVALAGGTDILNALKIRSHPVGPRLLVDLSRIPGLDRIETSGRALKLGAMVKLADLESDATVMERAPMLAQAAHAVASPQLRNMGTVGGNLCQEPRCWYYRYPDNVFHCLRKGGKDCPARNGQNRFHSIFGAAAVTAPPCRVACPGHTDIPGFLGAVRAGALSHAAELFLEVNPMPAVTGRVCPHFCQSDCNRGRFDDAVSIRNVERFVGDHILKHEADYYRAPRIESGRRVAIVGSGPAGLSAAYFLRKAGHAVVVFDANRLAGGMLRGIPKYRLPDEVTDHVVASLARMGIQFVLGIRIGQDQPLEALRASHDVVLLATGLWCERSIGIEGEELAVPGIRFLTAGAPSDDQVRGKRVLVIGGGNVAMDVAVTARRRGAAEVTVVYRRRREDMPAYPEEIVQAIEEGVVIAESRAPVRITALADGRRVLDVAHTVAAPGGRRASGPEVDASRVEQLQADVVFLAVGQDSDLSVLGELSHLAGNGLITADPHTRRTQQAGLYAAGDVALGADSVIGSIADGRKAAEAILRQLGEQTSPDARPRRRTERVPSLSSSTGTAVLHFHARALDKSASIPMPVLPVAQRTMDREDAMGLTSEHAHDESSRCFNCGCVATSPSDLAPALIALDATMRTTRRAVPAEAFFQAGVMTSTVLQPGEILTGIEVPAPRAGSRQLFHKLSVRGAIDFAQVSVAVVLEMADNRVTDARIVLGGVAPVPWRSLAAERALIDAEITEERAALAGEAAIREAVPLSGNRHVTRIVAATIKRTVLAMR